jgi:hypothetical protein
MRHSLAFLMLFAACGVALASETRPPGAHADARAGLVDAGSRRIGNAIDKGMDWLRAHPADIDNGEVMELSEEIIFYYAMGMMAESESDRQDYRREIAARHQAVATFNTEGLNDRQHLIGIWAPLTYPPMAHILARMDIDTSTYRTVIDELVTSHPYLYPPRNAMQLWIVVFMQRLGYTPDVPLETLLERSRLQQDPETSALIRYFLSGGAASDELQTATQIVYNMTHEIMALTDFGGLGPPAAMVAQRAHYARLLDRAMVWATDAAALDILAELVFCAHLLELGELPAQAAAVDLIIASQQKDGSFGITNPDRRNGTRHGVLTSVLALSSVQARERGAPNS